jgi:DNA polymerase-3 subunit epsilon
MLLRSPAPTFTAIDFETANRYRNSACAVGLVRVERGRIVRRASYLVRPPFRWFEFTPIHGISWNRVCRAPAFDALWRQIGVFLRGIDFLAAHNAAFDRSVLRACCEWYSLPAPRIPFRCTVRVARESWGIRPTTLRNVADYLGLRLRHHEAGSDAEACARIVMSSIAA